ncbi:MAG: hypothetical protein KBA66_00530 [Leptospiraceae bacterium]|nr:hypothetical protein [Leptospiraceae bacterium]
MHFIHLFQKKFLSSCVLFFLIINCEYYKAYKHNEEGIKEFNETKLEDSKTSFHKSISYSYKSYIPTYNIGNALLQEDDLPAAHEKFQEAIEANPEFKEALYNDGQALYFWGKKEVNPETCNTERAKVLWEQAVNRFKETASLQNAGDYRKPSLDNAKFIESEISKLDELKENGCQNQNNQSEEKENQESDSGEKKDDQKNQSENNQDNPQDKKDSKDKDKSDKDGKDSKDKNESGKDGKDSKDKNESGKDGKESKDKNDSGKDGKDSKDKDKSGKDGKDSKDKNESGKDGKDSKDKDKSGKDGKDSKDKDKSGKDGKDSKDKDKSGKDGKDSKDKNDSGKDGKDSKDKDKSGKDGKDSKDKDKSGKDGKDSGQGDDSGEDKNDQAGDNGYLPADEGGSPKPVLTPEEQKRLKKEMERVQKRSGESKNHKRSRHQQDRTIKDTEELERGLKEALW